MKLTTLLIVCWTVTTSVAGGVSHVCSGNGRMVRQFNGRKEDTKMACKYPAVRQRCGDYVIRLTPGNRYVFFAYRLDSLWLAVRQVSGGSGHWEGRSDNKQVVKFFNGWSDAPFTKKSGSLKTEDLLVFGKDSGSTWAQAKNRDFRVTFVPWDPNHKTFYRAQWAFECFAKDFVASGYPRQICGGDDKRETVARMNELELQGREQVVYYDVFTNTGLTQMNPKCVEATRLMTTECTEEQRREAMRTCSQILSSCRHSRCVSKHTCDLTDVFVDCIKWVCSDFRNTAACQGVGRGIDMCRQFKGGNLTARVEAANCYKNFLPLEP